MARLGMRWHPLMVPRTELTVNASPVGVEEGMENIMLVLEETVMPMMMDAVVIILGCDHYYQQCSVASGSDQPQFPPGYHPRRAISAADKGKDPMVRADLVIEVVQRALSGAGTMIRDGGRPTDGRLAGQLPPRLSALIRP